MNSSQPARFHRRALLLFVAGLLILALGSTAAVAGVLRAPTEPSAITAFSYQGYLQDNGNPANGPFDFEFKLFDAPAAGVQMGGAATLEDVTVLDGLFTVTLDFGVLIDATRYLETGVRYGAETGAYTILVPRQALTAVPFAANADLLDGQEASAFAAASALLVVTTEGSGGAVTSAPSGIACGATCLASFTPGAEVTLTAAADATSSFAGWTGACSGTGSCVLTMDAAKLVTAHFTRQQAALSVSRTELGTVTSSPAGLYCGAECSHDFDLGSAVTLTASPDPTAQFVGWTGACSGSSSTCTVTMDAAKTMMARFATALAVAKAGTGNGSVTSAPAGIDCGSTCSAAYEGGVSVTLSAMADSTSSFTGWTGACNGANPTCVVRMSEARSVTATFERTMLPLTVNKTGSGGGVITSYPPGIDCGVACSANYIKNTVVQLSATADSTSTFIGWSGACSGTGACSITVDAAKSVTASFVRRSNVLNVIAAGTGGGVVASDPAAIFCGPLCSTSLNANMTVTLAAAADSASSFAGWSGACVGIGSCVISMDQARDVTAAFVRNMYQLNVTRQGVGSGVVIGNPAGIVCGSTCAFTYPFGTVIALSASPNAGSTFAGWTGACSGTGTCLVTMEQTKNVTATFN